MQLIAINEQYDTLCIKEFNETKQSHRDQNFEIFKPSGLFFKSAHLLNLIGYLTKIMKSNDGKMNAAEYREFCGYDLVTNIEDRKAAHDGVGKCYVEGCAWVAKAKAGTFAKMQNCKGERNKHILRVHGPSYLRDD